jgi:hypothetical protein
MRHGRFTDERGSVLIWVTMALASLLMFAGLAMDIAYLSVARGELQRSLDAAALAGAGKLGFNDLVFPTVRSFAANFATLNPYRYPGGATITLNQNAGNAPNGNIVLGIWNGSSFTPSLDGTVVNAVRCQWSTQVPTSFLRLLGINTLNVSADAIAIASAPSIVPPGECVFPIGLTQCPFQNASGMGSQGCGTVATFIDSSAQGGSNTAAWVNLTGTGNPNASLTRQAIAAAFNGGCGGSLPAGNQIGANNGMQQSVYSDLSNCNAQGDNCQGYFNTKYDASPVHTVTDADGNPLYQGKGWDVYVPVIQTECPAGPINQNHLILTYTRFVIAQVINGGYCGVANHTPGNPWDSLCPAPNGTAGSRDPNLRAIFGYYNCVVFEGVPPVPPPAPIAALADHVKLVQ